MFEETLVAAAADESLEMIVKQAAPVLKYVMLPVLCVCLNEGLRFVITVVGS